MRHLLPYDDEAKLRYLEAWSNILDTDVIRLRQRLPQTPDNVGVALSGLDEITIVEPPFTTTTSTTTTTTTAAPTTTTTTTTATPTTTTTTAAPTTTTTTTSTTTLGVYCTSELVVTGDVNVGVWVDQAGGTTNLYQKIDELVSSPTDADYIALARNQSNKTVKFSRSTGISTPPMVAITSCTVNIRIQNTVSSDSTLIVRIYSSGGGTLLATSATMNGTSSWASYTPTMTLNNTTPSNWGTVEVWMTGNTNNGSKGTQMRVSCLDLKVCYTAP